MKALKIVGIIFGILFAVIVGGAYLLPRHSHVERSKTIAAPASVLFEQVNTLPNWNNWSPWFAIDPKTQYVYGDIKSGPGAYYTWTSTNEQVGKGKLTIDSIVPNQFIKTTLNFEGMGASRADYYFSEANGQTTVRWTLDSDMGNNPIGRWMGLMMDNFVGADYEKGLANLEKLATQKK